MAGLGFKPGSVNSMAPGGFPVHTAFPTSEQILRKVRKCGWKLNYPGSGGVEEAGDPKPKLLFTTVSGGDSGKPGCRGLLVLTLGGAWVRGQTVAQTHTPREASLRPLLGAPETGRRGSAALSVLLLLWGCPLWWHRAQSPACLSQVT